MRAKVVSDHLWGCVCGEAAACGRGRCVDCSRVSELHQAEAGLLRAACTPCQALVPHSQKVSPLFALQNSRMAVPPSSRAARAELLALINSGVVPESRTFSHSPVSVTSRDLNGSWLSQVYRSRSNLAASQPPNKPSPDYPAKPLSTQRDCTIGKGFSIVPARFPKLALVK